MSVVETFGLSVRYGQTWALRDCTVSIPEGHIVALVGSNGAGKTSLLHCAVGLTTPTNGTVTVLGHHIRFPRRPREHCVRRPGRSSIATSR